MLELELVLAFCWALVGAVLYCTLLYCDLLDGEHTPAPRPPNPNFPKARRRRPLSSPLRPKKINRKMGLFLLPSAPRHGARHCQFCNKDPSLTLYSNEKAKKINTSALPQYSLASSSQSASHSTPSTHWLGIRDAPQSQARSANIVNLAALIPACPDPGSLLDLGEANQPASPPIPSFPHALPTPLPPSPHQYLWCP